MSPQFHVPQSKAEADPRRWLALAVLLIASFMNLIDVTIVNVAIPSIQRNLSASYAAIQFVLAGYQLSFAVALITGGRLGDVVGRKRMFIIGMTGFTAASALCGTAPNPGTLVGARVLQGLMAALMYPQVLSVIQVSFPPRERSKAFGHCEHLQHATLGTVLDGESARFLDIAHHEDTAQWRHTDLLAAFERNVPFRLGRVNQSLNGNALKQRRPPVFRRARDQNFGACLLGQPLREPSAWTSWAWWSGRGRCSCWSIRWSKAGPPGGRRGPWRCSSRPSRWSACSPSWSGGRPGWTRRHLSNPRCSATGRSWWGW